jgi:hypothetical protein
MAVITVNRLLKITRAGILKKVFTNRVPFGKTTTS